MKYRLDRYLQRGLLAVLAAAPLHGVYAQSWATAANGLPILESNPGALSVAYIDFDGGLLFNSETVAPYGGDLIFDSTEQQAIYHAWFDVSTHFAMFDINVTTVAPNKSTNPTSHQVVTPDRTGGAANVGFHGNTSATARGYAGSGTITGRSTVLTHEFGHILGLSHQSEYDSEGNLVKQYRGVDQWNRAPMMGVDFAGGRYAHWADGTNSGGNYQDDAAKIADVIVSKNNQFTGNGYSGDGFRIDEHGNDFASATPLLYQSTGTNGNNLLISATTSGIIERYTDTDMFEFDWTGGQFTVNAQAVTSRASGQTYASSVGLNLTVYDEAGTVVAQDLAADPADVNAALNLNLGIGRYYVAFEGAGGIGDLGTYNVSVTGSTPDPNRYPVGYKLYYRPDTGSVIVDTGNGKLINYVIEGPSFIEENHTPLFGGVFGSSLNNLLSETDGSIAGIEGVVSLGKVLESGLTEEQVLSRLYRTQYVSGLGVPLSSFDVTFDTRNFNLLYDPNSGELQIDTLGDTLVNYVIEGSGFFEEEHTRILAGLGSSLDGTLSESSLASSAGVLSLGDVLPTGLTLTDLEALFTKLNYVAALGAPILDFGLVVLPITALPGDTDGDGDIDDADLGNAFANYTGPLGAAGGKTAAEGDTDGDGDVDDADLGNAFAGYTGPLVAPTQVPEPTSLLIIGAAGLLALRRRRAG